MAEQPTTIDPSILDDPVYMTDSFTESEPHITLREALTQEKEAIRCAAPRNRVTMYSQWPLLKDADVSIWTDFTLDNLNNSYGLVLDWFMPKRLLGAPEYVPLRINTADDVLHLIGRADKLMQPTLWFGKKILGLHEGIQLSFKYSRADKSLFAKLPADSKTKVDHIIGVQDFPGPNLVVGLAMPSSTWSGTSISARKPTQQNVITPLCQLANLCTLAGTKYGYIMTDAELAVCRFSMEGGVVKAAVMPIPWTKSGTTVLTTDLALWWLCMLAMSENADQRAIQ